MDKQIQPTDTALEKLEKILPAQATAAFLAVKAFVDVASTGNEQIKEISGIVIFFIILLVSALIPLTTSVLGGVKSRAQQAIMLLTFFIWAINIEYTRMIALPFLDGFSLIAGLLIPISLIIWAILIIPILFAIYKTQ